jgi:hypothetical protein
VWFGSVGGLFFVQIALFVLGIGLPIWAMIDASLRPDWAWERAGDNKALYLVLLFVSMILSIGCCGIFSLALSIVYFAGVRPKLRRIEKGGQRLPSAYPGFDPYRSAMYGPGSYTPVGYDEYGMPLGTRWPQPGTGAPGGVPGGGPGAGPQPYPTGGEPGSSVPPPVYGPVPGQPSGSTVPPPVYGPAPGQPGAPVPPPPPPPPAPGAAPNPPAPPAVPSGSPPGTPAGPPSPGWASSGAGWTAPPTGEWRWSGAWQREPPVDAYQLPPGTGPVFEPTPSPTMPPTFIPPPPPPSTASAMPADDAAPTMPLEGDAEDAAWSPPEWEPSTSWTPLAPPVAPPTELDMGLDEPDDTVVLPDPPEPTEILPDDTGDQLESGSDDLDDVAAELDEVTDEPDEEQHEG